MWRRCRPHAATNTRLAQDKHPTRSARAKPAILHTRLNHGTHPSWMRSALVAATAFSSWTCTAAPAADAWVPSIAILATTPHALRWPPYVHPLYSLLYLYHRKQYSMFSAAAPSPPMPGAGDAAQRAIRSLKVRYCRRAHLIPARESISPDANVGGDRASCDVRSQDRGSQVNTDIEHSDHALVGQAVPDSARKVRTSLRAASCLRNHRPHAVPAACTAASTARTNCSGSVVISPFRCSSRLVASLQRTGRSDAGIIRTFEERRELGSKH